ncbi:class I adenylate-forming enzyme family protein [Nocardia sp. BMG111209]|uniref:class I adenylate-forming enzyme family protein n=1 Tax=Nocardia sp. BMG111209 TaxID=1160137 RepID=UPI000361E4C0|nr:class I adenylate-forming enzyme family protein [Nocardia sp. BMG111209]
MTVEPTVAAVLRDRARARPDHPLLICDSGRLDYAEAQRRSALVARGLIALGAGKGTHVGILFPNDPAFVVAALAVTRIGAVVVPFSTFATAGELRQQLVDADIRILLAATGYRSHDYAQRLGEIVPAQLWADGRMLLSDSTPQLRHIVIDSGTDDFGLPSEDVPAALLTATEDDVTGSDPLAIIYTSGSTSTPKGVVHTHAAQLGHQRNLNAIRGLSADDRLFCNSPFFWIGGFGFALLATLLAGSTLICSNAVDDEVTLDLLEAEKPTITNGFAAGVAHLARHPSFAGRNLSSMRRGNLYPIMPADCRPADPELRHNMLGMTETGSVVLLSADETDQPEHRRGSFGRPAPGFELKLVDPETGAPVANGDSGELCFRGTHLMQGYYKRSREDCFDADGWFHTGDLARVDTEGFVYFLGRLGSMIKTAGANVSPAEVAKAIATVTGGAVAHVIGLPDPERGQVVAAAVVVPDPHAFDAEELRRRLRTELSAYKVPRKLVGLTAAQVPLMSSGKVDIRQLGKVFDQQ